MKRQGSPIGDELLKIKKRLEKMEAVWMAGKRRREESKAKEEELDVREFSEVVESVSVPDDLLEIEREIEEMVCKME